MNEENKKSETELIKEEIKKVMDKARYNGMLIGGKSVCKVISDKINAFERSPGNKSNNDHKRLIKDIKNFVEIGLSRKTDSEDETIQN